MIKLRLFGLSFLMLFTELALIRWIPANVRLVGFFSNLILIASFLGMGIGFLLAKSKMNLLYSFPLCLFIIVALSIYFRFQVNITSPDIIFFKPISENLGVGDPPEILLPIIFFLTSIVFIPLAQAAGKLFTKFPPLTAYTIDILGSMSGIIFFSLLASFSSPSYIWFAVISLVGMVLLFNKKASGWFAICILLVLPIFVYSSMQKNTIWSPYYKILVTKTQTDFPMPTTIYDVNVNNISHQYIRHWASREEFYFSPYVLFNKPTYKTILVIGAGTGADVATALALDPAVERIDAVEIDPKLIDIGRQLNPDKPYDDPRVHVNVNDGRRSFLLNSKITYDLIIYALTDSLTLTSNTNNIRLESFLFTEESFREAKNHLAPGGLFVLYNYYRETWLIDKIAIMLTDVFGTAPYVKSYGTEGKAAAFFAGPKTAEIPVSVKPYQPASSMAPATDDWPFLYLKTKSIPPLYTKTILVILGISSLAILILMSKKRTVSMNWHFFFMGAGFLLLETKNLINFALLFGNTWIVNSLVFLAILGSVLLANLLSIRYPTKRMWILYVLLFFSLLANYMTPTSMFAVLYPLILRYFIASIFYFFPVFVANLIFSQLFRKEIHADISFGSNLLGAVFGGFLEYFSLIVGYRALIIFVAMCYALAFGVIHGKTQKI